MLSIIHYFTHFTDPDLKEIWRFSTFCRLWSCQCYEFCLQRLVHHSNNHHHCNKTQSSNVLHTRVICRLQEPMKSSDCPCQLTSRSYTRNEILVCKKRFMFTAMSALFFCKKPCHHRLLASLRQLLSCPNAVLFPL